MRSEEQERVLGRRAALCPSLPQDPEAASGKAIVANLADEVSVSIAGSCVEITIFKAF